MIAMPMNPIRIASGAASSELNKARPPPASLLLMLTIAIMNPTRIRIGESAHPITGRAAMKAPSALRLFDVFAVVIINKWPRLPARRRGWGLLVNCLDN